MAELFKAMLGVLLLSAAGGGGAEAVSIGWVPSSDRFGGREVSAGKIATIALAPFAVACGLALMVWIPGKVVEVGQWILSRLWPCCRRGQ